jgi:hypothetical protein
MTLVSNKLTVSVITSWTTISPVEVFPNQQLLEMRFLAQSRVELYELLFIVCPSKDIAHAVFVLPKDQKTGLRVPRPKNS